MEAFFRILLYHNCINLGSVVNVGLVVRMKVPTPKRVVHSRWIQSILLSKMLSRKPEPGPQGSNSGKEKMQLSKKNLESDQLTSRSGKGGGEREIRQG